MVTVGYPGDRRSWSGPPTLSSPLGQTKKGHPLLKRYIARKVCNNVPMEHLTLDSPLEHRFGGRWLFGIHGITANDLGGQACLEDNPSIGRALAPRHLGVFR